MNSAQLIYRGKLRLSFNIPFLDTPFYLSPLLHIPTRGSTRGSRSEERRVGKECS